MADEDFRADQWHRRYDAHVAPINALVDELTAGRAAGHGPVPYVPPHYGGVGASILTLLSNPGPKAGGTLGSGFVSCRNTAPSSARVAATYTAAEVAQSWVTVWNAFPWYVHDRLRGRLTAPMRQAGVAPLRRLLALLPRLRVVVLHGGDARDGWARLLREHGREAAVSDLVALPTWHPSNQVLAVPPEVRAERQAHLVETYAQALALLRRGQETDPRVTTHCTGCPVTEATVSKSAS